MTANNNNNKLRLINPDPIRTTNPHTTSSTTTKKLCGNGSNSSYRHIHHQRGTIGTFHVRLLEANNLCRKHWSVLSLGHLKHLGLSNSHGEVSSFGTLRLGFWQDDENGGGGGDSDDSQEENHIMSNQRAGDGLKTTNDNEDDCNNSISSSSISSGSAYHDDQQRQQQFTEEGKSPLTPLLVFDQGSIKSVSSSSANGRSPFLQSYPSRQQQTKASSLSTPPRSSLMHTEAANDKPQQLLPIPSPLSSKRSTNNNSGSATSSSSSSFGLPPPHHYAKEEYKSTTVHSDNNPIWHGGSSNNTNSSMESDGSNTFNIPLQKDDLLPTIHNDGGKIKLEIRIDEELSNTEKLSGGALSTAVSAASVATSVVGIGKQTKDVSHKGMELLGLSTDRLIGKGVVDLMPLLLGYWDESNDTSSDIGSSKEEELQDSSLLNEYGQISQSAYRMRRRIGQLELLDVWVPLYHPSVTTQKANNKEDEDEKTTIETSGKVHLLISYTPNGMIPKPDDIVAFESFARRPISSNTSSSVVNVGPVITPIIPPLSPLLVIQTRGQYLLLEYSTSRTITSVDRNGNVKSSRYERSHRTRVHRNAVFVIERHTLLDAAGNIARLPGDIVLSTPIGQEIVQASAPLVAGAMELVGPAVLGGKLMMAAGWTGVKVSLAGARAATEAVVVASQEKALERRDGGQSDRSGEAGAYGYIG